MDTTTRHLLVPVDFSEKSEYGLQMAANLLKSAVGEVTVLNVIKGVDPIWSESFNDNERNSLIEKVRVHLENFAGKFIDFSKYKVTCIIKKGKLCDTILQTAEELNISAIVMGTSTADNIKKRIIGTNALRVVSEAKCPVITLKQEPKSEIKRIIIPLDVTKETTEKVKNAVQLAKSFNAEIFIVSAYTISDDGIIGKLESQQKIVVNYIKKHDISVSSGILKVSDRVDGVLNYIAEKKGDIILITTHQQLEIITSFLGSFAQSIIKNSNIPVVSIVPKLKHYVVFKLPAS
jgi:nucleotide-binding universal stress UspA family protein